MLVGHFIAGAPHHNARLRPCGMDQIDEVLFDIRSEEAMVAIVDLGLGSFVKTNRLGM